MSFGLPVLVIADAKAWPAAAQALAPLLMASPGSLVLVPVAGTTTGMIVAAQADLVLLMSDVFRQRVGTALLGYHVSLSFHFVAALGHPTLATHIAAA